MSVRSVKDFDTVREGTERGGTERARAIPRFRRDERARAEATPTLVRRRPASVARDFLFVRSFVRSFATRRDATLERRRSWRRGRALVDADFPRGGIEPESVELSFVARFRASLANGGDTDAGGVFCHAKTRLSHRVIRVASNTAVAIRWEGTISGFRGLIC